MTLLSLEMIQVRLLLSLLLLAQFLRLRTWVIFIISWEFRLPHRLMVYSPLSPNMLQTSFIDFTWRVPSQPRSLAVLLHAWFPLMVYLS